MTITAFTAKRRKPFVPQRPKPKNRAARSKPSSAISMYDSTGALVILNAKTNPANVAPGAEQAATTAAIRQALLPLLQHDRSEWYRALDLIEQARGEGARYEAEEQEALRQADEDRLLVKADSNTIEMWTCPNGCGVDLQGKPSEVQAVVAKHRCRTRH